MELTQDKADAFARIPLTYLRLEKPRLFQNMNPITAKSPANSSAFRHVIRGTLSWRWAGFWIKSGKTDITMQRRVSCSTISVTAELPSYRYLMKGGRMQTVTRS